MNWEVYKDDDGWSHVIPQNDRRMHLVFTPCWCNPKTEDNCIVHNSQDRREAFE